MGDIKAPANVGITASESVEDGAVDWLALTNVPGMGRECGYLQG